MCWNHGENILVSAGVAPKSKKVVGWKVYDTKEKATLAIFNRYLHDDLTGKLVNIVCHTRVPNLLYMIMYEHSSYVIYEVDIFHNECYEHSSFTGGKIKYIQVSEDLEEVFIVQTPHSEDDKNYYLYSIPFGESTDFDDGEIEPISLLGEQVHSLKTVGKGLIVVYEFEELVQVGIYQLGEFTNIEDKFDKLDDTNEYFLMHNNNIICLKSIIDDSVEFLILNRKSKNFNTAIYKVEEFSYYKYQYPYLIILKGGNEVFRYSFFRNEFKYLRLNSSFVATEGDSWSNLSFTGLVDIGDYYIKARINCINGNLSDFYLETNKRKIIKEYLPRSKIISCFQDDLAYFDSKTVEEAFLIH